MCTWGVALGHIEKISNNKTNGSAKSGKSRGERDCGPGSFGRGRRGGYSRFGEVEEEERSFSRSYQLMYFHSFIILLLSIPVS